MTEKDPFPYDGPIQRVDGVRPFNHYLWPTENWSPVDQFNWADARFSISIVELDDGRFSTSGFVWDIEGEDGGQLCVFGSRTEAIRASAARQIRLARGSKDWGPMFGGVKGKQLEQLINWARNVVAKETGQVEPKPVKVKEPPPVRRMTGLPLFDSVA